MLVAFYNATDGPNWIDNQNRLTDSPLTDWAGVNADEWYRDDPLADECVLSLNLFE